MSTKTAVIGLGFGDEGKGLVTNWLAQEHNYKVSARFSGGHQVGHTVVIENSAHVFQNFGSATASGIATLWNKDCCIDPIKIKKEHELLAQQGLQPELYIHEDCPVTTPYEVVANIQRANEDTVGAGIAETYIRESKGIHLLAKDLNDKLFILKQIIVLEKMYNLKYLPEMVEYLNLFYDAIDFVLSDTNKIKIISADKFQQLSKNNILLEGSQGLLLDERIGFKPDVSWGNLLPPEDAEVYMVTRAYKTRHGKGYFGGAEVNDYINVPSTETNQYNRFQGHLRTGVLDLDLLKYSSSFVKNSKKHIVVTCLDHVSDYVYTYKNRLHVHNSKQSFLQGITSVLEIDKCFYSESPDSKNIQRFI